MKHGPFYLTMPHGLKMYRLLLFLHELIALQNPSIIPHNQVAIPKPLVTRGLTGRKGASGIPGDDGLSWSWVYGYSNLLPWTLTSRRDQSICLILK